MKYRVKRHEVVQPLDQSYRLIPLTRGQNAIVDVEDFETLSKRTWFAVLNHNTNSFVVTAGDDPRVLMHRVVTNCPSGKEVDHRNHDTLDNRKENLRVCLHPENQRNRRRSRNNMSGYKGVSWNKECQKWQARIMNLGNPVFLGLFQSKIDAARAYDQAAKTHFGDFAFLNFP